MINLLNYKYDNLIEKLIIPVIKKDLDYIILNYDKTSFDIWEEKKGWHFYTRMVQAKFIKDSMNYHKKLDVKLEDLQKVFDGLIKGLKDHICDKHIISSFDENGKIIKYEDAANILAYCHIDYDKKILEHIPLEYINHTCDQLILGFRKKYNNDELNLIGRYNNDKYYDGQIWVLCSLALGQIYIELYTSIIALYDVDTVSPVCIEIWKENNFFIFPQSMALKFLFMYLVAVAITTGSLPNICIPIGLSSSLN